MGFRGVFITQEFDTNTLGDEFKHKYQKFIHSDERWQALSGNTERKDYVEPTLEFFKDLHEELKKSGWYDRSNEEFVIVWLYECGGVSDFRIHNDGAIYKRTYRDYDGDDEHHHSYCYGCSKAPPEYAEVWKQLA